MKIRVTMKDPDCLHDAIREAVQESMAEMAADVDEQEAVRQVRIEKAGKACERWFGYSEYLTVEIDTEANTAVVMPRKP